ncbi:unnamed protein product [Agarophyton chilense]
MKKNSASRERLYDLILERTALCPGVPVDFIAGSRNMLLRVETELPPLAAAEPNVLIIMQSVITAISEFAKSFERSYNSASELMEQCNQLQQIERGLRGLTDSLQRNFLQMGLSFVVKARSVNTTSPSAATNEYCFEPPIGAAQASDRGNEEFELDTAITGIGTSFFNGGEDKIGNSDESAELFEVMSRLYDWFIVSNVYEVRAFFNLGFRILNVPREMIGSKVYSNENDRLFSQDSVLAVSVWGIEFHASTVKDEIRRLRKANVTEMKAILGFRQLDQHSEATSIEGNLGGNGSTAKFWSLYRRKRIFYFALGHLRTIGLDTCTVELRADVCKHLKLGGNGFVALNARKKYQRVCILLDEI